MAVTIDGSSANTTGLLNAKTTVNLSSTYVDFTGIPAAARRITVLMSNISTSGTSPWIIQIGSGGITTTGYNAAQGTGVNAATPTVYNSTAGFPLYNDTAADARSAVMQIYHLGSFLYVASYTIGGATNRAVFGAGAGQITLGGAVDRVRLTTVNGTDTFDNGSMNIFYE
jgi:hypothetical protein